MIINRSKNYWETPELWTHGYHSQRVIRFQGLAIDIVGTKYSYVSIGKVASTFMTKFLLEKLKYPEIVYDYNIEDEHRLPQTYIVILRDPIERWCSGIVEYLVNSREFKKDYSPFNLKDRETLDLIFGVAIFDRHTCPQVDYLNNLDTENCIFFKLDKGFEDKIKRFTEKELKVPAKDIIMTDKMYNMSEKNIHKKELKEVINFEINNNPRYLDQIKSHFVDDIILYNSVNYYE